ncbi:MAG: zinc-ribbon domain-containing protein [Bacteroidales bacterium]
MPDHNTLDVEFPELLKEWDYKKNKGLKPEQFKAFSNKKVWWKCELGHNWQAPISRRSAGSVCPYCVSRYTLKGFNDLATTNPDVAKRWDYDKNIGISPTDFTMGSNKKVWWKCDKGHSWQAVIHTQTFMGCGCPYCEGKVAIKGENDLLTLFPHIAKEWDYEKNIHLRPEDVTCHSNKQVWWKCERNHSWKTTIHVRTTGHKCPYCVGFKAIKGENDLKTLRPDIAKEWAYEKNGTLMPDEVKCASNRKVWWKCEKGHSWKAAIAHRTARGDSCPYCSGRKVLKGFNDIGTTHPSLIREWDYEKNKLTPYEVSAGSNKKVWWKCKSGHEWLAPISERTSGSGCPYDCGRKTFIGYNDLATVRPDVAAEWNCEKNDSLTPKDVTVNSNKKVWWKCKKNHSWQAVIYSRAGSENGSSCPYCTNHTVLENYNDFKTYNSDLAKEWDYDKNYPLRPENVAKTANFKVWWKCGKGHSYSASMSNRHYGKGCPYCEHKYSIIGETDLASCAPDIAKEWHKEKNKTKPEEYTCCSNKIVWWLCKNEHSWRSSIRDRYAGNNCPYCNGRTQMKTRLV